MAKAMNEKFDPSSADNDDWSLAHPFAEGLIQWFVLWIFVALATAIAWGLSHIGVFASQDGDALVFFGLLALGVYGFMLVLMWGLGMVKLWQIHDFLRSDRPLIRWRYTPTEWQNIQAERLCESFPGIALPLGCMTTIFGVVGLAVGGMVGIEDGVNEAVVGAFIGVGIGASIGVVLGSSIALGSHLSKQWVYRYDRSDGVVLGTQEILSGRSYFKGNGRTRYLIHVDIQKDNLVIDMENPKIRGESEETWYIPIPHRLTKHVTTMLPKIKTKPRP
jgi:hypothetical protein